MASESKQKRIEHLREVLPYWAGPGQLYDAGIGIRVAAELDQLEREVAAEARAENARREAHAAEAERLRKLHVELDQYRPAGTHGIEY